VSIVQALVLGAVQGLTEFIPISSSGHLVIVPELMGWEPPGLAFDVLLHAGSLIALLIYFSGDLLDLFRGAAARDRGSLRLLMLLVVGSIPAGLAGLLLGSYFEDQFEDASGAALQLLITASVLVAAEAALKYHERRTASRGEDLRRIDDLGPVDATAVGIAQAIAIWPGISRSGSTIGAGLALGMARDTAARFAFLLAIPALFGAALVQIPDLGENPLGIGSGIAGFMASLVTSYVAIAGLLRFLRTNTLYPFAVYCVVAGPLFYVLL